MNEWRSVFQTEENVRVEPVKIIDKTSGPRSLKKLLLKNLFKCKESPTDEKRESEKKKLRKAILDTQEILDLDLRKDIYTGKSMRQIIKDQPNKVLKATEYLRTFLGPEFVVTPFVIRNEIVIRKKEVVDVNDERLEHEQEEQDISALLH